MDEKAKWRAAYRSVDAAQKQLHAHFKNGPAGKSEAGRALLGEHQKAIRRWRAACRDFMRLERR